LTAAAGNDDGAREKNRAAARRERADHRALGVEYDIWIEAL
jgi:hypothetical protein